MRPLTNEQLESMIRQVPDGPADPADVARLVAQANRKLGDPGQLLPVVAGHGPWRRALWLVGGLAAAACVAMAVWLSLPAPSAPQMTVTFRDLGGGLQEYPLTSRNLVAGERLQTADRYAKLDLGEATTLFAGHSSVLRAPQDGHPLVFESGGAFLCATGPTRVALGADDVATLVTDGAEVLVRCHHPRAYSVVVLSGSVDMVVGQRRWGVTPGGEWLWRSHSGRIEVREAEDMALHRDVCQHLRDVLSP